MNIFNNKHQRPDITGKIVQAICKNGHTNTAIVTGNLNLLQKLEIILSNQNISLIYKKPFINSPIASLIISSLDLVIHDFRQSHLLILLKEPLLNLNKEKVIDFIENKALRSIKKKIGVAGIKEKVAIMPEATRMLSEIEHNLLLIKNIKSNDIKHYVYLTLNYLKNLIQVTEELNLFFKYIMQKTSYPINSTEEYKNLLVHFMKQHYQTLPITKSTIYAFCYNELQFIMESNIIVIDEEIPSNFIVADNYIQEKNIITICSSIENINATEKNLHLHNIYYCTNNFDYNPPIYSRPKHLTPTMIQSLIKNPYEFYLKYILKLSELEPIGKKPSNLELGILFHEVFAKFSINQKIMFEEVWDYSEKMLSEYSNVYSYVRHIWSKKIEKSIKEFIEFHNTRISNLHDIEVEKTLSTKIAGLTVSARMDRIEHLKENKIAIIDYKTGSVPSKSDLMNYSNAQILVQGIILADHTEESLTELMYLGFENNSLILSNAQDLQLIEKFKVFLEELLEKYINQETPLV